MSSIRVLGVSRIPNFSGVQNVFRRFRGFRRVKGFVGLLAS